MIIGGEPRKNMNTKGHIPTCFIYTMMTKKIIR